MGFGGGKVNIKSNVYGGAGGRYSTLGSSSRYGTDDTNRHSPTTGTAVTDRYLSTYYAKMTEIKSYEMAVDDDYIRSNPTDNVLRELKKSHCFKNEKRRALTKMANIAKHIHKHFNKVLLFMFY